MKQCSSDCPTFSLGDGGIKRTGGKGLAIIIRNTGFVSRIALALCVLCSVSGLYGLLEEVANWVGMRGVLTDPIWPPNVPTWY